MPHRPHKIKRGPRPRNQPLATIVPPELREAARGVRLQKVLAAAGVASRRDCEELIRRGRVLVNGQVVTGMPAWVDPQNDRIEVEGRLIARGRGAGGRAGRGTPGAADSTGGTSGPAPGRGTRGQAPRSTPSGGGPRHYVLLHKPRATISTTEDPAGRRHVLDLIPPGIVPPGTRLYPVGRLDADSTGLILLTDDGDLAHHITHPRFGVPKTYLVAVRGEVSAEHIRHLQDGLYLSKQSAQQKQPAIKRVRIDQVRLVARDYDRQHGPRTILEVTLHEGHNRIIRRMLARLGYKVRRLHRTAIGPLNIKGLARGDARNLTAAEVRQLRRVLHLTEAGGKGRG